MKVEILKGKAYEITDNTIIIVETDDYCDQEQAQKLVNSLNDAFPCPVHVFSNGLKVKVIEAQDE